MKIIKCKNCDNKTIMKRNHKKFCSRKCKEKAYLKRSSVRKSNRNKKNMNAYYRRYNTDKLFTEKIKIRNKTRLNNKKKGICFSCKLKVKTEFHHLSYKPNKFIELCWNCHKKEHKWM